MMTLEEFRAKAGFDIDNFIRNVKDDLGLKKVRVKWDNPTARAMSQYIGDTLEIHLPDIDTILSQKPELSEAEAKAKLKSAVIEETCHGIYHETDHTKEVVGCTIREMEKQMSQEELNFPYIKEKIERLKKASEQVGFTPLH